MSKRSGVSSSHRTRVLRVLVALVALLAVAWFVGERNRDAERSSAAAGPRHFAWARGSRSVYGIRWDAGSRRTVLGGSEELGDLGGSAVFAGEVSVRSLGADASGVHALVYTLEKVTQFDVTLGEDSLFTDKDRGLAIAAMIGQEAHVRVDSRGVVRGISHHKGTPASVRDELRQIVLLMQVTLPADTAKTWTADETTPNGDARARYDERSDGIHRSRIVYQNLARSLGAPDADHRLSSDATITLDPALIVRSIVDREQLHANGPTGVVISTWTFSAQLGARDTFSVARVRVDDLDGETGQAQLEREREKGRDQRLSAGYTLGSIEIEIELAGRGRRFSASFVPHAAAFVRAHPESAQSLLSWFDDERLTDVARQLTMDVLSSAGSDEAQAAMRQAMMSPRVKLGAAEQAALIQRFIFVRNPSPESARFVADFYERVRQGSDTQLTAAAAAALGGVIDQLQGADRLAEELDARLRAQLMERRSVEDTIAILRALGNARTKADLPAVAAFAADEDAGVRLQVARSLKHFSDPVACGALLRLAHDPAGGVATAAFAGLRMQVLSDDEWTALAKSVEAGETPPRADDTLVELIERRPDSGTSGKRILRFVLARMPTSTGNQEAREHVQRLIGTIASSE